MAAPTVSEPATGYRWRWHVLAVVLVAEAMDILDTTTVNVAGPSVRRSIGGSIGLVQWLSASYTLASPSSPPQPGSCSSCPSTPSTAWATPRLAPGWRSPRSRPAMSPARWLPCAWRPASAAGRPSRPAWPSPSPASPASRSSAHRQAPGPGGLELAGPVLALGLGLGGTIAPLFTILTGITPGETGSAAGSLGAIQQLAASVGVAAIATLYAATSHPAARGLAITALATAALLAASAALTLFLPPARRPGDSDRPASAAT
jgi:MFS family permease